MGTDERKWKIWSPPSVPGTGSPAWERPYVDTTTGRCLQINAIEDGGSAAGVSWDSSSGWWQMNNRRLLVIDGGTEQELPSGTGQSPHVYGLCRVGLGNSSSSRLVAAGSNLWVEKDGCWRTAVRTPTIGNVLAVAKDGVLLGGHSVWRNGKEVALDKLVENQKVDGPDSAARYTNLRGYAMNSAGSIVALADDALNPGTGRKTLLILLPVDVAVDANRDGTITFDGQDATTAEKPYVFWANNDCDDGHSVDGGDWEEDDLEYAPGNQLPTVDQRTRLDCWSSKISCRRDLEDFSRLWIYFSLFRRICG